MKTLQLSEPLTLNVAFPNQPERIITTSRINVIFRVDTVNKYVVANLPPVRRPLVVWGPRQFHSHAADDEVTLLAKVEALLGEDKNAALTALNAQPMTPYWLVPEVITPAQQTLVDAETSGITLPFGEGTIRLAASVQDRALFASALTLYRTAEDLLSDEPSKEAFRSSMIIMADAAGQAHQLTIQQARQLLVQYGVAYQQIWAAAASEVV